MIKFLTEMFAALLVPYILGALLVVITDAPLQHAVNILFVASPLAAILLCTAVFVIDNRNG